MTISSPPEPLLHADFVIGPSRSVLRAIHDSALSFAIWHRSLSPETRSALSAWSADAALDIDCLMSAQAPLHRVMPELDDLPSALGEDVDRLRFDFRHLSDARRMRITLGVKHTNACRKFHTDFVRLRLITTYVGPGTEWVPNAAVDRHVLAHPPARPREANRKIVRDVRAVRRVQAGDVLLMKGERYAGALAAVHRSPPIESLGLSRLVLTLTTAD